MSEQALVTAALSSWKGNIERADRLFSPLNEEQLQKEVAPGKNRLIYLWGHLTAVHDRMLPLLGLGERLHPEFDPLFLPIPIERWRSCRQPKRLKSHGMTSTANCPQGLQVFPRLNGWRSIALFLRKNLLRIHHAIDSRFCSAEPRILHSMWGKRH